MKRIAKTLLSHCGIEIRLTRNVAAARQREKQQQHLDRWAILKRYQPTAIIDAGANQGQAAQLFRSLFPSVPIYSFEPLADCHQLVDQFLSSNGPGKAFHCALGNQNEKSTIHRSEFTPSSSILPMDELHQQEFPHTAASIEEEIEVRRLDEIASELELGSRPFLKVDVQGFEQQVIEGGEQTIKSAAAMVIELTSYPLYQGQSTFEGVQNQLEQLGYVFRGTVDQMHSPKDGRILQFDALFENPAVVTA